MTINNKIIVEKPYVEEENLTSKKKIKIVDLFAGIGGFHYGIAAAAAKIGHGVKPLLVSEIEPSCQETYSQNHNCEVQGDINKIRLKPLSNKRRYRGYPSSGWKHYSLVLSFIS